ncbi:MAG: relaxase domain-containing protein, partial [Rhodospirillales bacterium]|nr:relaxase domain-containing protein [Rhodospirillales bacterium]
RTGGQKMVAATFRHDTSRNLDPQLHTHCVIANMVQGGNGKWRMMVNDGLYQQKMTIGTIYRAGLAEGLRELGYGIDKTHADGCFEISGVPRDVIEAFSTRRAASARRARTGTPPRATLMTWAAKRDMDKVALHETWQLQARAPRSNTRAVSTSHGVSTTVGTGRRMQRWAANPRRSH